uniref:Uncharacterized protein n=1 Tax=Cacopsylla melanoneura TaxID=428564 RepID=A0A8D8V7F9_9HEMI
MNFELIIISLIHYTPQKRAASLHFQTSPCRCLPVPIYVDTIFLLLNTATLFLYKIRKKFRQKVWIIKISNSLPKNIYNIPNIFLPYLSRLKSKTNERLLF